MLMLRNLFIYTIIHSFFKEAETENYMYKEKYVRNQIKYYLLWEILSVQLMKGNVQLFSIENFSIN